MRSSILFPVLAVLAVVQCASAQSEQVEILNRMDNKTFLATVTHSHQPLPILRGDKSKPGDFVLGFNEIGNRLAHLELVNSDLKQVEVRVYTDYPIRFIEARDRSADGSGGYVRRVNGGIDERYLYIVFGSVAGAPINFALNVWTKDWTNVGTPAADFEQGALTNRSLLMIIAPLKLAARDASDLLEVEFGLQSLINYRFTYFETFDVSASGKHSGNVLITGGGIGSTTANIRLTASAAGEDINLLFVAYAENVATGGNSFMLSKYGPGMEMINHGFVYADAVAGSYAHQQLDWESASATIGFVQGWDQVEHGTGVLNAVYGGVGERFIRMHLSSGLNEPVDMYVAIYGS